MEHEFKKGDIVVKTSSEGHLIKKGELARVCHISADTFIVNLINSNKEGLSSKRDWWELHEENLNDWLKRVSNGKS